MDASATSRMLLEQLVDDFDVRHMEMPNQEYLEYQLGKLDEVLIGYRAQSKNPKLAPKDRARARDRVQAVTGMIKGIKFSISFWLHKDQDLLKLEEIDTSEKPVN